MARSLYSDKDFKALRDRVAKLEKEATERSVDPILANPPWIYRTKASVPKEDYSFWLGAEG